MTRTNQVIESHAMGLLAPQFKENSLINEERYFFHVQNFVELYARLQSSNSISYYLKKLFLVFIYY